ncbi:armadillo/beta-catenin/plakoglobin [Cylindrobasidium torrendii FP15055 ss-10]|uniref:Uridine kinase n=1 Tax=Cylindrobasidium torrendii FP15055 ss-10 TaxID=1314674 RepID=A0A0D7BPH2_9AGAR|nr:armadillo/beta-catenin/plakoglobin [Cylindrobasidium torrendii FP15055 ss-10]
MESRLRAMKEDLAAPISSRRSSFMAWEAKKNTVLVSHGRPPWYGEDGQRLTDAFVIGIAGGSGSGKTHVARQIVSALGNIPSIVVLSQDSFYKRHTPEEIELAFASLFDFDHPDSIDMPLFAQCLSDLKQCKQTNVPVYSFAEHQRLDETKYLYGASVIIAEGIMALQDPALRSLYDLKIFVQCDSDLMLARRLSRDVKERGRDVEGILGQYLRYVKPSYDNFVHPTSAHADIIVPGMNNTVAIELITTHVKRQMEGRAHHFRQKLATPRIHLPAVAAKFEDFKLDVLKMTPQLQGIFTIIRDANTSKQDFIFFVDRLSTILVEHAMAHLPYEPATVMTPIGTLAHGSAVDAKNVCGVLIQRSGGALERGFRRVLNDVPVGSLLVQSDSSSGEPLMLQVKLPTYVRNRNTAKDTFVFLLDAQIGTGAAAFMAIRILLDHGVPQDHIIFVCFLVARDGGVLVIRRAFPGVKIVCAAVDDNMEEGWLDDPNSEALGRKFWLMQPGMGQIGDRYYL